MTKPLYLQAKYWSIYPLKISDIFSETLEGRAKNGKSSYKYFVFFELIGIKYPGKYIKGSKKEKLNSEFDIFVFWKIESLSGTPLIKPWKIIGLIVIVYYPKNKTYYDVDLLYHLV